jgi:threonine dehydratase
VEGYGGIVTVCEPTQEAREAALEEVVAATGATFVHPYENPWVIAGQGTAALELLEEVPDLDVVVAPVGGGGLLSGTALAAAGMAARVQVVGSEPAAADDARRSLELGRIVPAGNPQTVADGLRTTLGKLPFAILRAHGVRILTATEQQIVAAMRLTWERVKLVAEPSGAVPLAVILAHREVFAGLEVGVVISGGNVDLDRLPW